MFKATSSDFHFGFYVKIGRSGLRTKVETRQGSNAIVQVTECEQTSA